jgi:Domain of unknown function (DUF4412)
MRKTSSFAAFLLFVMAAFRPVSSQAQLFKQLLNTVKNTAQGRANNKADQTTNKSLDKVDTTSNSFLGAFSKSGSSGNPSDTSAANMTMKALGLFAGGGGVSAADSTAAFESFRSASGGSGMFYQYEMKMTSKKDPTVDDTTCSWFTNNGEGRSEMELPLPGMKSKITSIGRIAQPRYSLQLYADSKTYGLTVIDTSLINGIKESFQITRVGTESVGGYSCTHVKMITTTGSGIFKSKSEEEIWTSTAVPGYALYKRLVAVSGIKPQMMQALDQAGAGGFFVKMTTAGKDYSMTMMLIHAEEKNNSASLFEIPAGYTKTDENMMQHMMAQAMASQASKKK